MAIVVRIDDVGFSLLKFFFLAGWQEMVGADFQSEILDVQDQIYFYRQYLRKTVDEWDELLHHTANLSVSCLRTGEIGTALLPSLDLIDPALSEKVDSQSCSRATFMALLGALRENAVVDTATSDDEYPYTSHT